MRLVKGSLHGDCVPIRFLKTWQDTDCACKLCVVSRYRIAGKYGLIEKMFEGKK